MQTIEWYTLNHTSQPKDGRFWAEAAAYDTAESALFIRFKSGVVCRYENIHAQLFPDLVNAPSAGKWIHRHIYHYPYTIVPTAQIVD